MATNFLAQTLQMTDSFEVLFISEEGNTVFSAETTKAGLENKVDSIEIRSGIHNKRKCILKTNKDVTVNATLAEVSLGFIALKSGVTIDTASKKSYVIEEETTVTLKAATITGATEILAVKALNGTILKRVTGTPAVGQYSVTGTTIAFEATFADAKVYVSYTKASTKDCASVKFNGKSFAKNGRLIMKSIAYDQNTEDITADVVLDFYKASLVDDFSFDFSNGSATETELSFNILTPKYLPNGTLNTNDDLGELNVEFR